MTISKGKIVLCVFLGMTLISIVSSVSYSRGVRSVEAKIEAAKTPEDEFTTEQVNQFLKAYYSFTESGDNYKTFQKYLTSTQAKREEERFKQAESKTLPQYFGHSVFLSSENYIRKVSKDKIEVICYMTNTMDLLNAEGKIVTKGIKNQPTIKLYYVWNKKEGTFLVDDLEQIAVQ